MNRRLLAALAVGVLPWTVLAIGNGGASAEFVFAWGILNTDPPHAVSLYAYLFEFTRGLPDRLLAWPLGVLFYLSGLASIGAGAATDREDRRFTAGVLGLSGLSNLAFTIGIARRNSVVAAAVPVGAALLWALAWWSWSAYKDGRTS